MTTTKVSESSPATDIKQLLTELRAILFDESHEPRNRLQAIDSRITSYCPAAPAPARSQEPGYSLRDGPVRTFEEIITEHAERLTQMAGVVGLIITIERKPLQPLAMGHAEYVIETRPARRAA